MGSVLCLSILAIVISIVKIAGIDLVNGQIDSLWGFFWFQIEASVAVMAVSATIFRSLFLSEGPKVVQKQVRAAHILQPAEKALGPRDPYDYLPSLSNAVRGPTTSDNRVPPSRDRDSTSQRSAEDLILPLQMSRETVARDVSLEDEVSHLLLHHLLDVEC